MTGTLSGTPLPIYVANNGGYAISLEPGSYVMFNEDISFESVEFSFFVEFNVHSDVGSSSQVIASASKGDDYVDRIWWFQLNSAAGVPFQSYVFFHHESDFQHVVEFPISGVSTSEWHSAAVVVTPDTAVGGRDKCSLYIDGQIVDAVNEDEVVIGWTSSTVGKVYLGDAPWASGLGHEAKCSFDNFAFWSRALSAEEVQSVHDDPLQLRGT